MANSYCKRDDRKIVRGTLLLSTLFHFLLLLGRSEHSSNILVSSRLSSPSGTLALTLVNKKPKPQSTPKKIIKNLNKTKPKTKKVKEEHSQIAKSQNNSDAYDPEVKFNESVKSYVHPIYPRIAKRRRIEGKVILDLKVNSKGVVTSTEVLKSSGHLVLDESALRAVKQWKFKPFKSEKLLSLRKNIIFKM